MDVAGNFLYAVGRLPILLVLYIEFFSFSCPPGLAFLPISHFHNFCRAFAGLLQDFLARTFHRALVGA